MEKEKKPTDFSDASKVMAILDSMQTVENVRAADRAMIDTMFNGKRPFSDAEVKEHQIRINVNWNEGNKILQDANRQVNNATLHVGKFFEAVLQADELEQVQKDSLSLKFTSNLHKLLKGGNPQYGKLGKKHLFLRRTRNASVCLHGVGPLMWTSAHDPLPRFVPLEDLLIPTDTNLDFINLSYFGVNMYLTQSEFYDLSHSDKAQKGWNKKLVAAILDALKDPKNGGNLNENYLQQPEKWQENFKQNKCYYDADSAPRVRLRWFLYRNSTGKWFRKIVLRELPAGVKLSEEVSQGNQFIFDSNEPFADDIDHILHCQFGDCSIVPPLRYHSVRGLGVLLYSVIECMNRMRCQFVQHVFDSLAMWLRVQSPTDRARQAKIELFPYTILEEGVQVVPQAERHQVNPGMVDMAMSQFRQLMSESGSSFTQDINDGTSKEMTATEAQARLQSVNVMVGGMLQMMYSQEVFYFQELIRRFCQPNPTNPDVVLFQKMCIADGIPKELLVPERWCVEIEKVLGAGDQMLAQQEATALLSQSQRFDPDAQRTILKLWSQVITRNADLANQLVPIKPPDATAGTYAAEEVFGTLMEGVPVSMRQGIDQQGYIESMIGMMAAKVGQIENAGDEEGGVGTPEDIIGLATVGADIEQHVALFAQNEENAQLVKQYQDALGQLMNMVKAFAQRLAEKMQSETADPEAQAKAESMMMLAETKSKISQAQALQKMQLNQAKFAQKQRQDQMKLMAQMQKEMAQMKADLADQMARTRADIASKTAITNADIKLKEKQANQPKKESQPAEQ